MHREMITSREAERSIAIQDQVGFSVGSLEENGLLKIYETYVRKKKRRKNSGNNCCVDGRDFIELKTALLNRFVD